MVRLAGVIDDCGAPAARCAGEAGVGEADDIFVAHSANRGDEAPQWIEAVEDGGIYHRLRRFASLLMDFTHISRCGLQILHRLRRFMEID